MSKLFDPYTLLPPAFCKTSKEEKVSIRGHDKIVRCDSRDARIASILFPDAHLGIRNKKYPAIQTADRRGERFSLYLRRLFADLWLREEGRRLPDGYVVKLRNREPFDLHRRNLKIIPSKASKRGDDGGRNYNNGAMTHFVVGIRLDALLAGQCPEAAMRDHIVRNTGGENHEGL